jgi:peptide deformylase
MAILKIARLGHPVLRKKAIRVPEKQIHEPAIQQLIQDMIDTLQDNEGVGLAAPQVHESLQIVVMESLKKTRSSSPSKNPFVVLINPVISPLSKEMSEDWEGCLSLPDLRGMVPRHKQIKVQAFDPSGKPVCFKARDFQARVIQHECDHLHGTVYLDRMRNLKTLTFLREFSRFWVDQDE